MLSDLLPPPEEAGASWDVPTTVGIITKLSPLAQRFMIFYARLSALAFYKLHTLYYLLH